MADINYTTGGFISFSGANVTVNGPNFINTIGDPGTTISWTGGQTAIFTFDVTDVDGDGQLVAGVDTFTNGDFPFTGYTATSTSGTLFAIFYDAGADVYFIPTDAPTLTQGGLGLSGTSNPYQGTVNDPNLYLCFGLGTHITTPAGPRAVEHLQPGDLVLTAFGEAVPVVWLGRQTVSFRFGVPERLNLVRVHQGALGEGIPHRDLTVTADHALLIDGLLINAGALVNGTTITRVPLSELGGSYTVYNIETEAHEVILAEGAPAETFIDYVGRQAFDNYAEYVERYGQERDIVEMAYPRITSSRLLPPNLQQRLQIGQAA